MSDLVSKALRTLRLTGETTFYASRAARANLRRQGICACLSGEKVHDALLFKVLKCLDGCGEDGGKILLTKTGSASIPDDGSGKSRTRSPLSAAGLMSAPVPAERVCQSKALSLSLAAGRRALTKSHLILTAGPLPEAFVPAPGQMVVSIFGRRLKENEVSVSAFPFDGRQRTFFHSDLILAADGETARALGVLYGLRGIYGGRIVDAASAKKADLISDLLKGTSCLSSADTPASKNRRLLFYAGALPKNGITSSLKNLLSFLPRDIDAWLCTANVEEHAGIPDLTGFDRLAGFIDIRSLPSMTLAEQPRALAYFVGNKDTPSVNKSVGRLYARELDRVLPGISFDAVIHFNGYGRSMMGLMGEMTGKKIIFVHNDLPREIDQKGRQHLPSLLKAYRSFDHIAVVSKALIEPTRALAGEAPDIQIVPNCHDFAGIRARALMPIEPDPDTEVTLAGWDTIDAFLAGHRFNMITIGRFSAEKNHAMILEAFHAFHAKHPDTSLTIIGGYGDLYEETRARVVTSAAARDICLIRSISNPMPILSRCQLFVLASLYEGQPMVLAEAGCLGIPAIAVASRGSKEFMDQYDGTLVECSPEGLVGGFEACLKGGVRPVRMDYDHYNETCLEAFLKLLG